MTSNTKNDNSILNGKYIVFIINLIAIILFAITDNYIVGIMALLLSSVLIFDLMYALPILFFYSFLDHDIGLVFGNYPIIWLMLLFICILFLNAIYMNKKIITINHLIILIVILLSVFSAFLSNTMGSFYYKDFIMLLLILFFVSLERVNSEHLIILIVTSAVFAAIYFVIYNYINPIDISLSRYDIQSKVNINAIAFVCMQVFCVLLTYAFHSKKRFIFISFFVFDIFMFYLLIAYSSRTAIFSSLITAIFIFYCYSKNRKGTFGKLIKGFLLTTVAICILLSFNWNSELIERLSFESIINDQGSNRIYIWSSLVKSVIPNNWLFGIGMEPETMHMALQVAGCKIESSYAHSFLLGLLVQCGLPCGILIISIIFNSLKGIKRVIFDGKAIVIFSIILSALIMGIGESTCFYRSLWFGLAAFSLYCNSAGNEMIESGCKTINEE